MITLYTLCPECKKEYTITAKQLRISRAIVECKHCTIKFDALEFLNDTPVQRQLNPFIKIPDTALPPLPWENKQRSALTMRWDLACLLSILLLAFQIYWFQSNNLAQNPNIRPWLENTCAVFNCTVPTYANLSEISITHGDLRPSKGRKLILQIAFNNNAKFKQNLPGLKLILLHFNGDILSQRTFSASEYSPSQQRKHISAGEQMEIKLIIARPPEKIGGYKFELT